MTKLRSRYANLVLFVVSLFTAIYIAELFMLFFLPDMDSISKRVDMAKKSGISFDARDWVEVVETFAKEGVYVTPYFCPQRYMGLKSRYNAGMKMEDQILPLNGLADSQTIMCNENGKYTIYDSDEHGFNNPKGMFSEKDIDILLVGDSFTHGACVEPGEDIGSMIRDSGKNVINLGIGGNGPLLELATLIEFGKSVKPKVVLWLYYEENDVDNLISEMKSSILLKYLNKRNFSQNLINRQPEIDRFVTDVAAKYMDYSKLRIKDKLRKKMKEKSYNFIVQGVVKLRILRKRLRLLTLPVSNSAAPPPLFKEILKNANDVSAEWGGKLYFIYLPEWARYARGVDHKVFRRRDKVLSIVKDLNIPIIDMHEIIASQPVPLTFFPFRLYGHYTKEGYSLTAQTILDKLVGEI